MHKQACWMDNYRAPAVSYLVPISVDANYRGIIAWREISCSRRYVSHTVFAGSLCAYLEGGRCCSKLGGIDIVHGSTEEDSSSILALAASPVG